MQLSSLILVTVGATLLCIFSLGQAQKTCNIKEIDMCVTNFYYDQKGVPNNERQLKKACHSSKTLQKCLNVYMKRCMSKPIRGTMELVVNSMVRPFNEICQSEPGSERRLEIFKHSKCLNDNSKQIGVCADRARDTIFFALESDYDKRIPITFCNTKLNADCTTNKTAEICGQEAADFQKRYYSIVETINELSPTYNPYDDSCKDFLLPEGWKSKEDPKAPLSRMINAFF